MQLKRSSIWFLFIPTVLIFYISLFLVIQWKYPEGLPDQKLRAHLIAFSFLFVIWTLVFYIHNLFNVQVLRRYTTIFFGLLSASLTNLFVSVFYFYVQPELILTPRRFLLLHLTTSFVLLMVWYLIVKFFYKHKYLEPVYLFSFNNELQLLEWEIKRHNYLGFDVKGHLNEGDLVNTKILPYASIILPDNLYIKPQVVSRFYELRKIGVKFYDHKDFYELLLRQIYLPSLNELWFLENISYSQNKLYNLAKRLVDILFGLVALIVFIITLPLITLAIKLGPKGPLFFVQDRVGHNGQIFKVYKYRTMGGGRTDTWTERFDPRITGIGKFLRKTHLDELPQVINLLKGNMSLVGPRPEQAHIVERLKKEIPFYDERHLVKPGVTGWSQLHGYAGNLEENKRKLSHDLYYLKHRSFWFDLEIILKTAYNIFTGGGR